MRLRNIIDGLTVLVSGSPDKGTLTAASPLTHANAFLEVQALKQRFLVLRIQQANGEIELRTSGNHLGSSQRNTSCVAESGKCFHVIGW